MSARPVCRPCRSQGRRSVLRLSNTDAGEFWWCPWCDRLRCSNPECRRPILAIDANHCATCGVAIPAPILEVPPCL